MEKIGCKGEGVSTGSGVVSLKGDFVFKTEKTRIFQC